MSLKIEHVEVFLLHDRYIFAKIISDDGVTGWGEASAYGAVHTARLMAELGQWLIGKDALNTGGIWQELFRSRYRLGPPGMLMAAMSALDIAMYDLRGRALGTPVWNLLGGKCRDSVPVYASFMERGLPPTAEIERVARRYDQGFRAVKFHTSTRWGHLEGKSEHDNTLEIIRSVREVWGSRSELQIIVDVNNAYSLQDAIRIGRQLQDLDVLWFEEPLPPWDIDGYRRLTEALDIPIAAGEQIGDLWQFRDLIERGGIDILQPNVCTCGGFTQAGKIAALAEAHYRPIACHNIGPSLMTVAHLHCWASWQMCTMPQEYYSEDVHELRDITPVVGPSTWISDGRALVPDGPGLGVDVDEAMVQSAGRRVS